MKVIILAGGQGLRLREILKDIPKPMALVAGKPFLEYLILQLIRWNIKEIIFSIGFKGNLIRSHFGNGKKWGVNISYSAEKKPLGTGGALRMAVQKIDDEHFIVMNGDSFLDIDFNALIDFHRKNNAMATMGLVHINDTSRYGRVETNGNGRLVGLVEKGIKGKGTINGGIYIFNHKIADVIPSGNISLEKEVLPVLIGQGFYGMIARGFFVDIGTPEDYLNLYKNPEKLMDIVN